MMRLFRIMPLVTALAVLAQPLYGAATSIVIFGDSMSDTGNVQNATGSVPNADFFDGRYTNGPVWIEYEAARRGLPAADLLPYTEGGRNYAHGGAESGMGLSYLGTPNIGMQISLFQSLGTPLTNDDLVVVWAGSNDMIFGDTSNPSAFIGSMVNNISVNISTLMGAGATNFYIPNLPDLSKSPLGQSLANPAGLQALVMGYNSALEGALAAIESANPGVSLYLLDVFGILNQVIENPSTNGFTNTTTPAYSGVSTGPPGQPLIGDPNTSIWWDAIHPTTKAHELIPEPSVAWLTMIAALVVLKRRRD